MPRGHKKTTLFQGSRKRSCRVDGAAEGGGGEGGGGAGGGGGARYALGADGSDSSDEEDGEDDGEAAPTAAMLRDWKFHVHRLSLVSP